MATCRTTDSLDIPHETISATEATLRQGRFLPVFGIGILTWLIMVVAPAAADTSLKVHVDQPGAKISPTLYGIFFEEINRAGEGGLYGEMIQNRSFEDDRGNNDAQPQHWPGWSLVADKGAKVAAALDNSNPLNPQNPNSLRLEISKTEGGRAGVANEGFRGIAVRQDTQYALSLYARSAGGLHGSLAVSIEDKSGKVFAAAKIDGVGPEWKRFATTLTATDTTTTGRLVISTESTGTLWLDSVSLFDKATWKGRPNGLRTDLADMLDQMKPSFVRFPGGCYVEGNKLANAFRWKKSIGELARRPGHWNLWGYRSTDGLGYYEYLQMCEDLRAEPLFVINCGMAHEDSIAVRDLGPWVQDALDAIEYANGSADSRWGALRAKAGHPAPFHLKYMEIGNENGGPVYQDHYRLFYDAIKAKYPQMRLVANEPTRQRPTEILDEHYYSNPEFFMARANQYDKYNRNGPKIYVGEYAVTEHCGQGNLRAALGEAAFMTGMERNADVVVMASYAPLFVNAGWRQWNPNAIVFDNARVFGTPSYHLQKMFCRSRGDVVLGLDFDAPEMPVPSKGGVVGVGTWNTKAEYKDIRVTQGDKILFQSDFKDLTGWRIHGGRWQVKDGALQQTADGTDFRAVVGDKSWHDYTLTLKARKLSGAEGFLILFNTQDENGKSWWNIGGWGNARHAIEEPGWSDPGVSGSVETGRWYDIRIETRGSRVRCFLDGKLIHDINPSVKAMYAVASRAASGDVIIKVVNVSAAPQATTIELAGLEGQVKSATATVLTSANLDDENSFAEPNKVVPVAGPVDPSARFRHTFPANSATVLQIKVSQ
jgi:alpha-L-arabinofuranosidase